MSTKRAFGRVVAVAGLALGLVGFSSGNAYAGRTRIEPPKCSKEDNDKKNFEHLFGEKSEEGHRDAKPPKCSDEEKDKKIFGDRKDKDCGKIGDKHEKDRDCKKVDEKEFEKHGFKGDKDDQKKDEKCGDSKDRKDRDDREKCVRFFDDDHKKKHHDDHGCKDKDEEPKAVPLPAAAWMGLSTLIGTVVVQGRRKLSVLFA